MGRELKKQYKEVVKHAEDALNKTHQRMLSRIKKAEAFLFKMQRFISDEWEVRLNDVGELTIQKGQYFKFNSDEKNNAEEWRQLCNHAERILGKKNTKRYIDPYLETLVLSGSSYTLGFGLSIVLGNPDCKLTVETEEIPAQKRTVYKVNPACLGA